MACIRDRVTRECRDPRCECIECKHGTCSCESYAQCGAQHEKERIIPEVRRGREVRVHDRE